MLALTSLFSSLLSPVALVAAVLGGIALVDQQEVVMATMSVPSSVASAGYTSAVIGQRIHSRVTTLESGARTSAEGQGIQMETDTGPLQALGSYLGVMPMVRALQTDAHINEYTVDGDIVDSGGKLLMRVRIRHRSGRVVRMRSERPLGEIEQLMQDAAEAILYTVNPQIFCAGLLRGQLKPVLATAAPSAPLDLAGVKACIFGSIRSAIADDRIWLYNLLGVTLFIEGDQAGALTAFRGALALDRDFSPTLLNIGVMFASNGKHEEAIRFFRQLFHRETFRESPQTHAAALSEWGDSLVALGRTEEAQQRYAAAVERDPRFAIAYFRWASTLPPGPEADRLTRLGMRARGALELLYTDNLIGPIRRLTPVAVH